jgi:putative transposase
MYAGYRYPSQVISHAVWLYHRFTLSFPDVEELLAARGVNVTYESVRNWCVKFGNQYCSQIRKKRGQLGDTWYLDEVFVKINGDLHYLWRAVDQDEDELDILVQKRRNKKAAIKFFRKLLKGQQATPLKIVTDKLRSYSSAKREIIPSVAHCTEQYENNRCELSHQSRRQQERQMRRFKSPVLSDNQRERSAAIILTGPYNKRHVWYFDQSGSHRRGFRVTAEHGKRQYLRAHYCINDDVFSWQHIFRACFRVPVSDSDYGGNVKTLRLIAYYWFCDCYGVVKGGLHCVYI